MGPQMCLNFLRSLASDFPDICLQFFMGNFNFSKFKIFLRTILYIFTRLPTCQGGLQNRDYRNDSIQRPPSNKRPPLPECVFVNKRPILLSAPILKYCIRVRVRINRGSYSFNCSQTNNNATSQKQCSYVHVGASILQTNDLFFKFCGDCSAGRSGEEGSRDNKSFFQSP